MLTRTTIVLAFLAKPFLVCNPQPTPAVTGEGSSGDESTGSTGSSTDMTSPTDTQSSSSSSTAVDPMCGDGVQEGAEQCDDGNQNEDDACLNNCLDARCGDDLVWSGMEECDDGDQIDTNACTAACKTAFCGDGIVWEGMEECDDGNQDDTDGCTSACKLPVCGDGTKSGTEECDDGANNVPKEQATAEQCTTDCKIACGDGTASANEECDDANLEANDGCSPTCTDEFLMFVTADSFPANLGGVAGADEICQMAATGKLTGSYVAWISVDGSPASADIPAGKPMIRPDGLPIVATAEDLFKGNMTALMNPVAVDVDGNPVTGYAWTGTTALGQQSLKDCMGWTMVSGDTTDIGALSSTGPAWTNATQVDPKDQLFCDASNHLYCFRKADL